MSTERTTSRIRSIVSLLALFPLLVGCGQGVWLPDSSGMIYSTGEELRHYDIATRQSRGLPIDRKADVFLGSPAVSPDGKHIAVASAKRGAVPAPNPAQGDAAAAPKPASDFLDVEITFYDLTGKEISRSPTQRRPIGSVPTGKSRIVAAYPCSIPAVWWDGPSGKFIVPSAGFDKDGRTNWRTGVYDPAKKKWMSLLVEGIPLCIGGTPVRPDGKGLLVAQIALQDVMYEKLRLEAQSIHFVDWDGKPSRIDLPKEIRDDEKIWRPLWFPALGASQWRGNTAIVTHGQHHFEIDTDKHSATWRRLPDEQAKVGEMIVLQRFTFANNGPQVRSLVDEKGNGKVEMLIPGKPARTIAELPSAPDMANSVQFVPSPDGKWLLLTGLFPSPIAQMFGAGGMTEMLLINSKGEVTAIGADGRGKLWIGPKQ